MKTRGRTSWLLDGRNAWLGPSAVAPASISVGTVLTLAGAPGSPDALDAPDGSLGGLSLPRGVAVDARGDVYLLGPAGTPWLKRLGFAADKFVRLTAIGTVPGTDAPGSDPRQFAEPGNLAAAGPFLYVADTGNGRVQVFTLPALALRFVWGPRDGAGRGVAPGDPAAWQPVDVTAAAGRAYFLDRKYGNVFAHRPGDDAPALVVATGKPDHWDRLLVDASGGITVLAFGAPGSDVEVATYGPTGLPVAAPAMIEPGDLGAFAGRFGVPLVVSDDHGRISVQGHPGLLFDRLGEPVTPIPDEPAGPPTWAKGGTWFAGPLDSHLDRCAWDTIEVMLDALPPDTTATLSTITADSPLAPAALAALPWDFAMTLTGWAPSLRGKPPDLKRPSVGLVQSTEGRYLWVKLDLAGDGYATPSVASIRVRYPRRSWVADLPAVYSEDDASRRSLERFLAVFQATADGIGRSIATIRRLFDPKAVSAGPFLNYLAGWLGVPIEEAWTDAQKRRHLVAAPGLLRGRGTVKGLRDALRVDLADAAGDAALDAYPGLPAIVEGFRFRRSLLLGKSGRAELGFDTADGPARLSGGDPTWGPSMTGRLVLGGYDRLGEGRLITEGSPERDVFDAYAHQFRVLVPAAWVRDASVSKTLARTLARESPASANGTLVTVGARLRVGVQSTVGLDAIIAPPPGARLGDPGEYALGLDVGLPPRPVPSDLRLDPGARVGVDTNLT